MKPRAKLKRDIWFDKNTNRVPDVPKGAVVEIKQLNIVQIQVVGSGQILTVPGTWLNSK